MSTHYDLYDDSGNPIELTFVTDGYKMAIQGLFLTFFDNLVSGLDREEAKLRFVLGFRELYVAHCIARATIVSELKNVEVNSDGKS